LFSYRQFVRHYISTIYTGLQENKTDYPEELISVFVSSYMQRIKHLQVVVYTSTASQKPGSCLYAEVRPAI